MNRAAIVGSAPEHSGSRRVSDVTPETPLRLTIVLKPSNPDEAAALLSGRYEPGMRTGTPADEQSRSAVETWIRNSGLTIAESDAASRSLVVTGPASAVREAFGIKLGNFAAQDGSEYLSYEGELTMPSELSGKVTAVLGLDNRPVAKPR
jgi:kumamolisin